MTFCGFTLEEARKPCDDGEPTKVVWSLSGLAVWARGAAKSPFYPFKVEGFPRNTRYTTTARNLDYSFRYDDTSQRTNVLEDTQSYRILRAIIVGENGITMKVVRCEEGGLDRTFISDSLGETVFTLQQALGETPKHSL